MSACSPGIVGEADENGEDHYLWTYKKLEIGFNGNRIVDVNLTSEGKVRLVPNTRIAMSYSVSIKPPTRWSFSHLQHLHIINSSHCR